MIFRFPTVPELKSPLCAKLVKKHASCRVAWGSHGRGYTRGVADMKVSEVAEVIGGVGSGKVLDPQKAVIYQEPLQEGGGAH